MSAVDLLSWVACDIEREFVERAGMVPDRYVVRFTGGVLAPRWDRVRRAVLAVRELAGRPVEFPEELVGGADRRAEFVEVVGMLEFDSGARWTRAVLVTPHALDDLHAS